MPPSCDRAAHDIDAPLVTFEAHISNGLPRLSIVGLPETVVRKSKDRVRGALLNSRFDFPARRISINLTPANLPKTGGRFDLAIAVGTLAAAIQTGKLCHGIMQAMHRTRRTDSGNPYQHH